MKKNLPLYILLLFLIIVNAFFLYNYLGTGDKVEQNEAEKSGLFLIEELDFDEAQQQQFKELGQKHQKRMRAISNDIRVLKDELFKGLSDSTLKDVNKDSIARLIGDKEAAKDLEVFSHFNQVQALCNDKQKEKFSAIIKDALRRGDNNQGPPPGGRSEGGRPPHLDGERPPHPDGPMGDRPPPPEH
ncbi:Spy/CpxP family protein refolding chaperone [Algibacter sp. R77976]|uniref:Spy/CpxP family protein refolding chaperone n=1 Tax=Algibacter sp. R77976 TaxID=3093873 RepID=UPI0037C5D0AA